MKDCRAVQDSLPEYITGQFVADRERIAGHLSRCEACDDARRELEAVFALLAAPEIPESRYGEANTKFVLKSMYAPGPLRSMEEDRRREDLRFRVCALLSASGAGAFALMIALLWNLRPALFSSLPEPLSVDLLRMSFLKYGVTWQAALLFVFIGGLAALLPALVMSARSSASSTMGREA